MLVGHVSSSPVPGASCIPSEMFSALQSELRAEEHSCDLKLVSLLSRFGYEPILLYLKGS